MKNTKIFQGSDCIVYSTIIDGHNVEFKGEFEYDGTVLNLEINGACFISNISINKIAVVRWARQCFADIQNKVEGDFAVYPITEKEGNNRPINWRAQAYEKLGFLPSYNRETMERNNYSKMYLFR